MTTNTISALLKPELPYLLTAILVGSVLSWAVFKAEEPPTLELPSFTGVEDLALISSARNIKANVQNTDTINPGTFVKENFYYFQFTRVGDWAKFKLAPREPGEYRLTVRMASSGDFGIVQIFLNGTPIGNRLNLYNSTIHAVLSEELSISLNGVNDLLEFQVVDKDPSAKAPYYQIGIDGIVLVKNAASLGAPPAEVEPSISRSEVSPANNTQERQ